MTPDWPANLPVAAVTYKVTPYWPAKLPVAVIAQNTTPDWPSVLRSGRSTKHDS